MKWYKRENGENLSGKSSCSFLSPALPWGWNPRWKNETFKDWDSILQEKQTNKRWGHRMAEARQYNMSHACGRSQGNNYKIATWYTGNKQSFYFSTLKHFCSGDLKIILQNIHCGDRKIQRYVVGIRRPNGKGKWNPQEIPGSELTERCYEKQHHGTGQMFYTGADSALMPAISSKGGASSPDPKHRAPIETVPLVPSPTSIYRMHLAINAQLQMNSLYTQDCQRTTSFCI